MRRLLLIVFLLLPGAAKADGLTVFAASSLTEALTEIASLWQAQGHAPVRLSFGASSTLARQIEQGAGANLFASADLKWMDDLAAKGAIAPDTRHNLLANSLVMVAPRAAAHPVKIDAGLDLAALLGPTGRLATGDPAHVPVGLYAEQALRRLGLWAVAEPRLARAGNVRGALLLVERGEAPIGIVYATDAAVSPGVAVIGSFPPASHDPIVYPFAVTRDGDTAEARALLRFIAGPQARVVFRRLGFAEE